MERDALTIIVTIIHPSHGCIGWIGWEGGGVNIISHRRRTLPPLGLGYPGGIGEIPWKSTSVSLKLKGQEARPNTPAWTPLGSGVARLMNSNFPAVN